MNELPLVYNYEAASKPNKKTPLVIMIHGYGSHENDLFSLKEYLGNKAHYLSLRAPMSLGFGGFAWYPIHFDEVGAKTSDSQIAAQSRDLILTFLNQFQEREGLTQNPIWLMGFSQGAILSYALLLNHPQRFSRVMALSGYVLKEIVPEQYRPSDFKNLDLFISHGNLDEVIPVQAARMTVEFLEKIQVPHHYQEYPSGHGINQENLWDLQKWFKKYFTG